MFSERLHSLIYVAPYRFDDMHRTSITASTWEQYNKPLGQSSSENGAARYFISVLTFVRARCTRSMA